MHMRDTTIQYSIKCNRREYGGNLFTNARPTSSIINLNNAPPKQITQQSNYKTKINPRNDYTTYSQPSSTCINQKYKNIFQYPFDFPQRTSAYTDCVANIAGGDCATPRAPFFLLFLNAAFTPLASSGFNNSKLHNNSSLTLITAPQLSNSPQ